MKRNISQTNVLESLNEELHSEFALHELEQRLETDPLFVAGLLNNTSTTDPLMFANLLVHNVTGGMCSNENQLCTGSFLVPCDTYIKPEQEHCNRFCIPYL